MIPLDEEDVVLGCPSGCRWGWLNTEVISVLKDDITEADVWTYIEFLERLGYPDAVYRCTNPECNYRTTD